MKNNIRVASAAALALSALLASAAATFASVGASPAHATSSSPNGRIAFEQFDDALGDVTIAAVNPDGTRAHTVSRLPLALPRWSPDGTRLAAPGGTDDTVAAHIFNPDTGRSVTLAVPVPGMNFGCNVWTADAKRLACDSFAGEPSSRNGIYTLRVADGKGLTRVTSNPQGEDSPESYSPDGAKLEFVRFDADGPVGLFVVNANGTGLRRITPPGMLLDGDRFGDWSPRGNTIVFAARVDATVRNTLWTVHTDGTGLHQIPVGATPACGGSIADPASRGCFDATYSPDGKKIAFIVNDRATTGESLYTVNVDGSHLRLVTLGGAEAPDWGTHPAVRCTSGASGTSNEQ